MLITTNRLGDALGAPSRFFIFKEDRMKRTLIRLMLLTVLLGCILAPSALAQRHRGGDRDEIRNCERTYRDALRSARGLPSGQRRIRTNEARREHADCL